MQEIRVAISPCPNDTYIFGSWLLGLSQGLTLPVRFFFADVEELNLAATAGDYDVIKVSAAMALQLEDYVILPVGGAFSYGAGPKLVTLPGGELPARIAVPGLNTTAFSLLRGALKTPFTPVPVLFSDIVRAVQEKKVNAGLLIHETALVYEQYGLCLHMDLGWWWAEKTGKMPLPLGVIVARKSLGRAMHKEISRTISHSLEAVKKDTGPVWPFIKSLARELDQDTLEAHIKAYVNDLSLDMGQRGREALLQLKLLTA